MAGGLIRSGDDSPLECALFRHRGDGSGSSERRLSIRTIAQRVGASANVTANCIALHRYLRIHAADSARGGMVPFPVPADFIVPALDEEVDEAALGLDHRC